MSLSSNSAFNIIYTPDEILIEIILYLNARERAALGNSSRRFYSLIFEEKKLLRELDFSKDGWVTSPSDIEQYFNVEDISKNILKVNLSNVICIKPCWMLNYFRNASNLVDINIQGIELKDFRQFGSLLEILEHIERLSVDWPKTDIPEDGCAVLQQSFGRLKYLSTRICFPACVTEFFRILEFCQKLEELHMVHESKSIWRGCTSRPRELKNLRIIGFCGASSSAAWLKRYFSAFLPKPKKWTDFKLVNPLDKTGFYFEKNVEICDALLDSNCIKTTPNSQFLLWQTSKPGFYLQSETLLKAVIKITQEKVPEEFCSTPFLGGERCALKIRDAKLLLKNPRYQIKYLYLSQSIGNQCDVHLLVLASPYLTELYLSDVMKIKNPALKHTDSQERFGWKHKMTHWEENYVKNRCLLDSTFKMLVENTPLVEELTLNGRSGKLGDDEVWDLGVLCLISRWTNLKSLRLLSLPISDGEFLIEISKQCTNLEKLELNNLGSSSVCCYMKDLSLMLTHCQNLRDFSIIASNIGLVSDLFYSLVQNEQLKRVRLEISGKMNNTVNLISSVKQLLCRCSKLTTFICIIGGISKDLMNELKSALQKFRDKLDRPTLQFQVVQKNDANVEMGVDTVSEDYTPPSFPYTLG